VVVVSYSGKEINAKLVYYGMGLSGKTTNLEAIYETVPETSRGKMVSMKTQSDRTLFFDLLPLDLGEVLGFKTRFLLYTVPGQVFYNATRKLVLKGADAIVFVADSERGKMDENKESLSNLRANLAEYKVNLDDLPWVIQYNKRDLPDVYTLEELERELNPQKVPCMEAVATQGKGVMETFQIVSKMLLERVTRDLKRQTGGSRSAASAATPAPSSTPTPMPAPSPVAAATATAGNRPSRFPAPGSPSAPSTPEPARAPSTPTPASVPAWNGGVSEQGYGREVALPSRTAAAPASERFVETAPAPAASSASNEMVVPIRIPRGQKMREINIRIVIEDEAA
jgi:signal recognition particle receptor subunit beta